MGLFYSASCGGFFDDAIHKALPDDAYAISSDRHAALLEAQSNGATIVGGKQGAPRILRHRQTLEQARAAATRTVKREAARRIEAVSPIWRQMNDQRLQTSDGVARFAAIDAIRTASNDIETLIDAADLASLAAIDIALHSLWPVN